VRTLSSASVVSENSPNTTLKGVDPDFLRRFLNTDLIGVRLRALAQFVSDGEAAQNTSAELTVNRSVTDFNIDCNQQRYDNIQYGYNNRV
jgi:hypothetical protein